MSWQQLPALLAIPLEWKKLFSTMDVLLSEGKAVWAQHMPSLPLGSCVFRQFWCDTPAVAFLRHMQW